MEGPSNRIGQFRRSHMGIRASWKKVLIFSTPAAPRGWYWSPGLQFLNCNGPDNEHQSKQLVSLSLYTEWPPPEDSVLSISSREISIPAAGKIGRENVWTA